MSVPTGVNQTYCSPRMKGRGGRLGDVVSFQALLVSSVTQEVIYFDSYLIECWFIQMKSHCCELNNKMGGDESKDEIKPRLRDAEVTVCTWLRLTPTIAQN